MGDLTQSVYASNAYAVTGESTLMRLDFWSQGVIESCLE
jgi:hypothetical protein